MYFCIVIVNQALSEHGKPTNMTKFFSGERKVTTGVYSYDFAHPLYTCADYKGNRTCYVGFETCGVAPQVVFDALHKAHGNPSRANVRVCKSDGTYTTTTLDNLLSFLNDTLAGKERFL